MLPVLIVGAGPTGLIMAIELARRSIPVRIIDKNKGPSDKSKALLIQARTLEVFEHIGVSFEVLQKSYLLTGETFYIGNKRVSFDFPALDSTFPFGVTLPQAQTEEVLKKHLLSLGVTIEWGNELLSFEQKEDEVVVFVKNIDQKETFNVSYVVGADGAHSTVRHTAGILFEGRTFPEAFALADGELEGALLEGCFEKDKLQVFIEKSCVVIIFPLPGKTHRVIVSNVKVAPGTELTVESMRILLKERNCPITIKEASWQSYFHVHSRHASRYRLGRVFLAGDAAHIHSPAGGLGMNTGIQDAYNLAWKIAYVLQRKVSDDFLDSYEKERLPVAEKVLKMTESFTKMMTSQSPLKKIIRRYVFPKLLSKTWIQHFFLHQASQLGIHYRKSPIVKDKGPLWGIKAGDRVPNDPAFLDLFKNIGFTLLIFTGTYLSIEEAHIIGNKAKIPFLVATFKNLRSLMGVSDSALFLIRPDHYIAYREIPFNYRKQSELQNVWQNFLYPD